MEVPASVEHTIYVTIRHKAVRELSASAAKARVIPSELIVRRGDTLKFVSRDSDLVVIISRKDLLTGPSVISKKTYQKVKIKKSGNTETITINPAYVGKTSRSVQIWIKGTKELEIVEYTVFCEGIQVFAEGGSSPRIIIDE